LTIVKGKNGSCCLEIKKDKDNKDIFFFIFEKIKID